MLAIVFNLLKIHAMKIFFSFMLLTKLFILPDKIHSVPGFKPLYSSIDWEKTKDWRLYYVRSKEAFTYSLDTLKTFKFISLRQDSMTFFLKTATQIPEEKNPVWMGAYVTSCQLEDGTSIKIEISQYGGFFYVERERRYYELAEDVRGNWLSFFTSKWLQLEDTK